MRTVAEAGRVIDRKRSTVRPISRFVALVGASRIIIPMIGDVLDDKKENI